ncbi:MAG: GNAT family N-acetyltransferase [Candidatus Omnitrophica bacterium]|nr:GNAT family N-acetyltransferase [Candidatus Omnitrophota bacterium]
MIRPSQPADAPQIVSLVSGILKREFPRDQAAYPPEDLDRIAEHYLGPGSTFLVAEEERKIVGTLGVKQEDAKIAILRRLFVDPSCRGKGVGSQLLKQALDFCRAQGFREVVIRTSSNMDQAIRLCCSAGFKEQGRWTLGDVTLVRFHLKLV